MLADGTRVEAGDPVGVLHLWNEHLPTIPREGPDLRWAINMRQGMARSMSQLAEAVGRDARLASVKAFGGNAVLVSHKGDAQVARVAGRYGFEWVTLDRGPMLWQRFHQFWENFLVLGLQWAFNPGGLRGKRFIRPREPLWISRDILVSKFAPAQPAAAVREPVTS